MKYLLAHEYFTVDDEHFSYTTTLNNQEWELYLQSVDTLRCDLETGLIAPQIGYFLLPSTPTSFIFFFFINKVATNILNDDRTSWSNG
jgi:hypothetical protein